MKDKKPIIGEENESPKYNWGEGDIKIKLPKDKTKEQDS